MTTLLGIIRLAPRNHFGRINTISFIQAARPVSIRVEQAKPRQKLDHDERNMNLKRPMSPHLTIYAPEIQSFLSISHRIAGTAMSVYLFSFGLGTLALPNDFSTYISAIDQMNLPYPVLLATRVLIILPFTYHGVNGIRHLVWDMGKLLYIKQVISSGYVTLGAAVLLALGLAS